MKKNYYYIMICIVIMGLVLFMYLIKPKNQKVQEFSVNEYQSYIEEFSSDLILGETLNASSVIKKAEKVWIEIYGKRIKKEKTPYKIFFDVTTDTWLVTGTLPKNQVGGVPYILIQKKDGKVLAVWHDR